MDFCDNNWFCHKGQGGISLKRLVFFLNSFICMVRVVFMTDSQDGGELIFYRYINNACEREGKSPLTSVGIKA